MSEQKTKTVLKDLLLKPTFMMCEPTNADPSAENENGDLANDFSGEQIDKDKALEQWHGFKDKIEELGGRVILVPPQEGCGGQVYTADPAAFVTDVQLSRGKTPSVKGVKFSALISQFTNAGRNAEIASHSGMIQSYISELQSARLSGVPVSTILQNTKWNTEGSGDNVYDTFRGLWWSGYSRNLSDPRSGRSDIRAHKTLQKLTDREVFSMEVARPFFHIDTSQTPLPKGHILSHEEGITAESFKAMRKRMLESFDLAESEYLIKVSKKDANRFACNLTAVTDTDLIVTDDISDKLAGKLAKAGYRLHPLPYDEMRKGGGLFHCTANRINITGPKGGIANDPDYYNRIDLALS